MYTVYGYNSVYNTRKIRRGSYRLIFILNNNNNNIVYTHVRSSIGMAFRDYIRGRRLTGSDAVGPRGMSSYIEVAVYIGVHSGAVWLGMSTIRTAHVPMKLIMDNMPQITNMNADGSLAM